MKRAPGDAGEEIWQVAVDRIADAEARDFATEESAVVTLARTVPEVQGPGFAVDRSGRGRHGHEPVGVAIGIEILAQSLVEAPSRARMISAIGP